jgi:hypothetical protein
MTQKIAGHWLIFIIAMLAGSAFGDPAGDTFLEVLGIKTVGAPQFVARAVAGLIIGVATYVIIDRISRRGKT